MGSARNIAELLGMNEIQTNAHEANSIASDTIRGRDDVYESYNEEIKGNLLRHTRQDVAWAALNTVLIYENQKKIARTDRICRFFILTILVYIAVKLS